MVLLHRHRRDSLFVRVVSMNSTANSIGVTYRVPCSVYRMPGACLGCGRSLITKQYHSSILAARFRTSLLLSFSL
jgi:Fe-S cluster biogenesis protein NfuA